MERYVGDLPLYERFYIEADTKHGERYFNAKVLEDSLGRTGILVEPHPTSFLALKKSRPRNMLFQEVLSNKEEALEFTHFNTPNLAAVSAVRKPFQTRCEANGKRGMTTYGWLPPDKNT
jgi:hypothetical protein